ncbi:uncharacterized protein HKW66_Vig0089970 [Vigna angularis]|uniref:Uncharacterized protein n=1 Tax=Phaseolus angularis TaxID=3914 RepID=A0A8T0KHR9_PHAAN|nr:uncharacterized protein HKW66_Vig0089970 [Vigna angularis]
MHASIHISGSKSLPSIKLELDMLGKKIEVKEAENIYLNESIERMDKELQQIKEVLSECEKEKQPIHNQLRVCQVGQSLFGILTQFHQIEVFRFSYSFFVKFLLKIAKNVNDDS